MRPALVALDILSGAWHPTRTAYQQVSHHKWSEESYGKAGVPTFDSGTPGGAFSVSRLSYASRTSPQLLAAASLRGSSLAAGITRTVLQGQVISRDSSPRQ